MAALLDTNAAGVLAEHGGKGFGAYKEALAEVVVSKLVPIATETRRLLDDSAEIDRILRDGAAYGPRPSPIRSSRRPNGWSAS